MNKGIYDQETVLVENTGQLYDSETVLDNDYLQNNNLHNVDIKISTKIDKYKIEDIISTYGSQSIVYLVRNELDEKNIF